MRVLNRYILADYGVIFLMTLLVFTFVMCVGAVMQAINYFAMGASPWIILRAFGYNIPYIMTFSIPMSAMTAVLLLFGRLSLDGEITAMRASGLSLWQIIAPLVFVSILLSILCVYLNVNVAPNAHWARRQALLNITIDDPISLLEEGRFIRDFPGYIVYVGKKERPPATVDASPDKHLVKDLIVYELEKNQRVRTIRAAQGELTMPEPQVLKIELFDVQFELREQNQRGDETRTLGYAEDYPVYLDFSHLMRRGSISKSKSSMTIGELVYAVRNIRAMYAHLEGAELRQARMGYLVEANERLALSLSCFAFTLIGIPLGMKSRRRESSVGVLISLGVVFVFYFFIIIADALVRHPHLHPELIVWVPVVLGQGVGFYLLKKNN